MSWLSGLTSSDGNVSLVTRLESDEEGRIGDFVSKVGPDRIDGKDGLALAWIWGSRLREMKHDKIRN